MVSSKNSLAELVGKPVTSFAYPYGYYNNSVLESAGETFSLAFTCDAGLNDLRTDLNRLKRAEMEPYYSFRAQSLLPALRTLCSDGSLS